MTSERAIQSERRFNTQGSCPANILRQACRQSGQKATNTIQTGCRSDLHIVDRGIHVMWRKRVWIGVIRTEGNDGSRPVFLKCFSLIDPYRNSFISNSNLIHIQRDNQR